MMNLLQVTYEAHKEYLAKMYEEYQRQEEENIKKGKKGLVSTISGLSAQASGIKGAIREMDDNSQTPESEADYESADSRNLLAEGKGPEEALGVTEATVDGVRVEVHDLLVDIKAEKVEATEVKLDDLDLTSESLGVSENGTLVEVDSLLDNVYCAAVEKLNSNANSVLLPKSSMDDQNAPPLITLDDDKDGILSSNNFLFGKVTGSMEDKLLADLSPAEPLVLPIPEPPVHTSASDDLSLLAHMTGSSDLGSLPSILEKDEFELQAALEGISSLAATEAEASFKSPEVTEGTAAAVSEGDPSASKTSSAADATSSISDTERSDDGKDKEMKKIQTTATTQVCHAVHSYKLICVVTSHSSQPSCFRLRRRRTSLTLPQSKQSEIYLSEENITVGIINPVTKQCQGQVVESEEGDLLPLSGCIGCS